MNPKLEAFKLANDVFEHHKRRIAEQTLKMPDAMAGVMGGPSKAEAAETLGHGTAHEHTGVLQKLGSAVGGHLHDMHEAYKRGANAAESDLVNNSSSKPAADEKHSALWHAGYHMHKARSVIEQSAP